MKVFAALRQAGSPPPTAGDVTRCLTFHLKDDCFVDCPRKVDHVHLIGKEKEDLFNWCNVSYPEPE